MDAAACLLLDLQLPEMSGLQLQDQLVRTSSLPIVFISGCGDIPSSVRAMKSGALEFLTKPIDADALIEAVRTALARDRDTRQHEAEISHLQHRLERLSPREREAAAADCGGISQQAVRCDARHHRGDAAGASRPHHEGGRHDVRRSGEDVRRARHSRASPAFGLDRIEQLGMSRGLRNT